MLITYARNDHASYIKSYLVLAVRLCPKRDICGDPLWDSLLVMFSFSLNFDVDLSCPTLTRPRVAGEECRRLCFCRVTASIVLFSCHHCHDSIKKLHSSVWPGQTRRPVIDRKRHYYAKGKRVQGEI